MNKLINQLVKHSMKYSVCHRLVSTTSVKRDIFKVQDENDFKTKVLESKEPVIVDFFAT